MGLTWDEFLKLTTVISNLYIPIAYFNSEEIEIKEKNRRVSRAAQGYKEFFNDFKYMEFMNEVRISFKKLKTVFSSIS